MRNSEITAAAYYKSKCKDKNFQKQIKFVSFYHRSLIKYQLNPIMFSLSNHRYFEARNKLIARPLEPCRHTVHIYRVCASQGDIIAIGYLPFLTVGMVSLWETKTESKFGLLLQCYLLLYLAGHPLVIHNAKGRSRSNPDLFRARKRQSKAPSIVLLVATVLLVFFSLSRIVISASSVYRTRNEKTFVILCIP